MSQTVGPQSAFQEKYLNSDAKILIAGGAAGSSKSYIGLMRHLRWKDDPNYVGYCIRKNSTAIMKPGGLFYQAVGLYRLVDPNIQVKLKDQRIVFSSGASVTFSHYENTAAGEQLYQGLQMAGTFYDEATHAEEEHIWWLISRLRTQAKMNPSIWLSCNPDPDSYLRTWVDWWLFPEGHEQFGLPDPDKNGATRWLLRVGGDLYWADNPEELIERHGKKWLGVNDPKQVKPLAVQAIFGTIYDNPWLIENQPDYLATLESLPILECRRLLHGDWEARQEGSTYFDRQWITEVLDYPDKKDIKEIIRAYDFAGTLKSDDNPSPDYTATVKIAKMKSGKYRILDVKRTRITFGKWVDFITSCAEEDEPGTIVCIPLDPGVAAAGATKILAQQLAERGIAVVKMRASMKKLDRFRPFSSMAHNGGIEVLKGCAHDIDNGIVSANEFFYKELEAFTGERKRGESGHDDMVDAVSDAFAKAAQRITLNSNFLASVQGMEAGIGTAKVGIL